MNFNVIPKIQFNTMQFIFGVVIYVTFLIITGMLFFMSIPEANLQMINLIVGAIIGSVTTVVAFYFGSSKSSKDKDEQILNLNKDK